MCYLPAILGSSLALAAPHCEADFDLMVGFRSVIAASIELDGLVCDRVLGIEEGRFDEDGGRVLKVICDLREPAGSRGTYRVVAYTEGDFAASPWEEASRALARTP